MMGLGIAKGPTARRILRLVALAPFVALGAAACRREPTPQVNDGGTAHPSQTAPSAGLGTARAAPMGSAQAPSDAAVPRDRLCVTRGTLAGQAGQLEITEPTFRAVVVGPPTREARLSATFLGKTERTVALGSGDVRTQIGLKLRAKDGCNLVYVMWRIEPQSKLVVSVKSNPGKHLHAECGTAGYQNIKPTSTSPVPPWSVGETHVLEAALDGSMLSVKADGKAVWRGDLGSAALELDGPVGVRSDNTHAIFTLTTLTTPLGATDGQKHAGCSSDPGEE